MKNLVDVQWLSDNINDVVVIDATSNFLDSSEGKKKYAQRHIPGAFHMDLDTDLCGSLKEHGGRHPLPDDMDLFVKKLESIGVSNYSLIVVYDEGSMYAARFWWMCQYIGLEKVKVLDGGLSAWISAGNKVTTDASIKPSQKGKITINLNKEMLVEYADIHKVLVENTGKIAIVDSRNNERYQGKSNPIDPIAGHIPGALNYFFADVLDEQTKYKDVVFLKDHFKDLMNYDELIFYCGSGVSAAVNIMALAEIDVFAKFYIGSWSDYITHSAAEIVVEK